MLWWSGHRPTDILGVCSPPSRRVAALRPRFAGLSALTAAPRTLVRTGSYRTMPNLDPLHVVVDDPSRICRFSMAVDNRAALRRRAGRRAPDRSAHRRADPARDAGEGPSPLEHLETPALGPLPSGQRRRRRAAACAQTGANPISAADAGGSPPRPPRPRPPPQPGGSRTTAARPGTRRAGPPTERTGPLLRVSDPRRRERQERPHERHPDMEDERQRHDQRRAPPREPEAEVQPQRAAAHDRPRTARPTRSPDAPMPARSSPREHGTPGADARHGDAAVGADLHHRVGPQDEQAALDFAVARTVRAGSKGSAAGDASMSSVRSMRGV